MKLYDCNGFRGLHKIFDDTLACQATLTVGSTATQKMSPTPKPTRDTPDTSRIMASKAAVSSACFCVCSAIFSLNFRGFAMMAENDNPCYDSGYAGGPDTLQPITDAMIVR